MLLKDLYGILYQEILVQKLLVIHKNLHKLVQALHHDS